MEVHVRIVEARNVPAADINGKSDPYIKIKTKRSKCEYKTKTQKKTLTPKWDEETTFNVNASEILEFALIDYDKVGANDKLCKLNLRIHDLNIGLVEDRWWTMNKTDKGKKDAELHLVTHVVYRGQPKWQPFNLLFIDCYVNIVEAKNLPKTDGPCGKCDPYVKLTITTDQDQFMETKYKKNDLNPKWNEAFLFWVTNPTADTLVCNVWDKDVKYDDQIGSVHIPLATLQVGVPSLQWYTINPYKNGKNCGQLRVLVLLAPKGTKWNPPAKLFSKYSYNHGPKGMPEGGFPPPNFTPFPMPALPPF